MEMTARLGADISSFQAAMSKVKSTMSDVGKTVGGFGEKIKGLDGKKITEFGNSMSDIGKKATIATAPLAALGVASIKIGSDFQQSMANVSAVSGAVGADFAALEAKAREMGATTKFSASQSADALSYMAMAGWNTQQMIDGIPGVMNLAAASGADLALTSDILTDAITAFGDKASDAGRYADVMAAASSSANTNVEMLGESFKYVAPVAGAMGYSLEDASKALALMANNGIKASQGGTSLKNILTNLASPTKAMQNAMDDLGISIKNQDGSMKSLDEVMLNLRDSFSGLSEDQRAQYAATLAGKEGMAGLLAIVGASEEDFNKLGEAINNSNGKAQEMADVMGDTVQGKFLSMKSALEEVGIVIFNALEPALYKVIDVVTNLAQWFQNLSPSIQTFVIALGGIAVAIGPILMIAGTLISTLGSAITVFTTLSGALATAGGASAVFGSALAVLTGPIGLTVAAIAALGVGVYALVKHFKKDSIEPITRFGDEVSESTQKAVGAFMDMSEKADMALKEVAWSQQEMTSEMASSMQAAQQEITDTLITAINDRQNQEKELAREQLQNLTALSDEQKNAMIEKINERYEGERVAVEEGNARVNEIIQLAAEEKRALTQAESDEILAIRQSMTEQAVQVMSENEIEQKLIYEKMKENATSISALEAAEVVQNATKKKDDVIKEANEQYDETYKWAIRQRDELGTLSEEEAKAVIDEAKKKRDESIKNAEETHEKVVDEAKKQAKEHVNEVDWSTGEIKTKWQVFKTDVSDKAKEIGSNVKNSFKDLWTNTKSYFSGLWNDTKKYFSDIGTEIKTKVEDAKTQATEKIKTMGTNFTTSFTSIVSSARDKFEDVKSKIITPIEKARDTVKGVVDAIKGFFDNMTLKIPEIKMPKLPKFTMSGSFSLNPPSVPRVGVNWNAKGGIAKKATVINTSQGLQGFGEVPGESEAFLPLNSRVLAGIGEGAINAVLPSVLNNNNKTSNRDVPSNIEINFHVEKMVANEQTGKKLAKTVLGELTNSLKRERGVR